MPFPPTDGGAQAMYFTTLGLLSHDINVKILAINPSRIFIDPDTLPEDFKISTSFESVNVDTGIKPINFFINLFRRESYFIERFVSREFANKLQQILISESFDIVQLEHVYLCVYINIIRKFSNAKIILRPQNIEHIIWSRYLNNLKNPFKYYLLRKATERLKLFEQNISERLDGIIPLTGDDARFFMSCSNKIPVRYIPMGYNSKLLAGYNYEAQYLQKPVVYHLATMDWLPNIEAIKWFLKYILPLISKQESKIKIVLAGRKMPRWVYEYNTDNFNVLGEITDPLEFQKDKQIMIVPLLSGSGVRAKIIEGLALAKTIISTTTGAQGIEYENGKNILIADTPENFAEQIVRCIRSPELCREIGKQALQLSNKIYTNTSTASRMIDFYKELINSHA